MRIFLKENVYDAALGRIRRLYAEFPEIVVSFSGGKDSTVILNLTLQVAEELGRLPVNVLFIDQEAEWENTIAYVRQVMRDPRVKPYWFQAPFKIFNATSGDDPWLYCWKEGADWIRDREPDSIHENNTGSDRFKELFGAITKTLFPGTAVANIAGIRAEESPGRQQALSNPTYKDITWGKIRDRKLGHYDFYPIYDWAVTDVWKAIHDNEWPYCKLYDFMFQYGLPLVKMRVSNVHHETAVVALQFLQEIEPHTWNAVIERVSGVNAVSKVKEAYELPKELPPMFASWREYRDHLLENLIEDPKIQTIFRTQFERLDRDFDPRVEIPLMKSEIAAILVNDYHGTKLGNFKTAHRAWMVKSGSKPDKYSYQAGRQA